MEITQPNSDYLHLKDIQYYQYHHRHTHFTDCQPYQSVFTVLVIPPTITRVFFPPPSQSKLGNIQSWNVMPLSNTALSLFFHNWKLIWIIKFVINYSFGVNKLHWWLLTHFEFLTSRLVTASVISQLLCFYNILKMISVWLNNVIGKMQSIWISDWKM